MLFSLKKKWRNLHISKTQLKLYRDTILDKNKLRIINLSKREPNLIIIGCQKCGTTSLHNYLNDHPDIYMSSPFKEPAYFFFNEWGKKYWRGKGYDISSIKELKSKYMIEGFLNQRYFGESSTHYTIDAREALYNIPQKIKKKSPDARLIYIIRNPLERLVSTYYHFIKYWGYKKSLDNFIEDYPENINTTLYAQRLKPFLDTFEQSNILLLQFDSLVKKPQKTLNEVYKFLNLEVHLHDNFEKFHATTPSNSCNHFTNEKYSLLIKKFLHEKKLLENYFDLNIDWDLSKKRWTE